MPDGAAALLAKLAIDFTIHLTLKTLDLAQQLPVGRAPDKFPAIFLHYGKLLYGARHLVAPDIG
jgi:hypothetical protein